MNETFPLWHPVDVLYLKKKKERKLDKYQGDRILSPSKNDLKQNIYRSHLAVFNKVRNVTPIADGLQIFSINSFALKYCLPFAKIKMNKKANDYQ